MTSNFTHMNFAMAISLQKSGGGAEVLSLLSILEIF